LPALLSLSDVFQYVAEPFLLLVTEF
jgi:hypothetical protein